jgi:hypothetical protein
MIHRLASSSTNNNLNRLPRPDGAGAVEEVEGLKVEGQYYNRWGDYVNEESFVGTL